MGQKVGWSVKHAAELKAHWLITFTDGNMVLSKQYDTEHHKTSTPRLCLLRERNISMQGVGGLLLLHDGEHTDILQLLGSRGEDSSQHKKIISCPLPTTEDIANTRCLSRGKKKKKNMAEEDRSTPSPSVWPNALWQELQMIQNLDH